jgi:multidrug resistance efflux pump
VKLVSDEPTREETQKTVETHAVDSADELPVQPVTEEAAMRVEEPATEPKQKDPVRRWTLIVLILMAALFGWYLLADRFTPYTTQARLHALVVPVSPLISALVEEVHVTNNQRVAAGDPLFRLNTDDFELVLAAAEADLQSARQAVGAAEANVAATEASLKAAEARQVQAEQDVVRMRSIRAEDPGAISERRLQYAEATLAATIASVDAAKANLEKAKQDLGRVGEDNFRILQAQVAIADAKLNITRSQVYAPADGVVTDVRLDVGNFAGAGQAQMTFIATENLWVQADFTENNLWHIESGDNVQIHFDVLPGRLFDGIVRGTGFGVAVDSAPLGQLPTIENDRNWLREAQRFPVLVDFETQQVAELGVRVGSQATVTVFTGDRPLLNGLARLRVRLSSYLSYVY